MLENALKEKGITSNGHFRYLGYNPLFQLFGKRNEIIVSVDWTANENNHHTIHHEQTNEILMVLTSHNALGDTGEKTGFWIEEFATPYYVLTDAGASITLASPKGGQPPVDPKSELEEAQTPSTERFYKDAALIDQMAHSLKISDVTQDDYDAVFYPGGHGPLWDLATDKTSVGLIEGFYNHQKPIAFVCHAPAALIDVKLQNGDPLIAGKTLTGFSNTEEEAVGLTKIVPFLLEDELTKQGAHDSKGDDWTSYVKQDGLLITGQNPASSQAVAELLLKTLHESTK
jgi:putative intracellular protease/amidase